MKKFRPWAILGLLLLGLLPLMAGCSDDDPVIPTVEPSISSPDELVNAFLSAVETRDIEALIPLFDHETNLFSLLFREEDLTRLSLPAENMEMEDMIQIWRNIFSGQEILNNEGELVPGITGIDVDQFDRNTAWCGNECGPDSFLEMLHNIQKVYYRVEFTITRADGLPPLVIEGNLEMRVRPPSREGAFTEGNEDYALFGIKDATWDHDLQDQITFGEFAYQYFTNEAPEAVLTVGVYGEDPLHVDGFACESLDSGVILQDGLYRWRTDPEAVWTIENDQCSRGFDFPDYGEKMIEVEVLDRWGLSSRELVTFELTPPEGAPED